jgi:tripartite-type tricarboxylate transporter receptor subunit TctC
MAATAMVLLAASAAAQQYPSRAIRWVVGFPPGGGTDIISRMLGQRLTEAWGQQVIIDNRPGASAMIGANVVAKSPPDGYTVLMAHVNSQAIAPLLQKKPLYDPMKDFAYVAYVGFAPNVLVVHPSTPARNINELVALAKARPGQITFASPGVGSTNHLAGELFKSAFGINITHVPYKGSGPAIIDLLAGHIVMNFDAMSSVVNYIKEKKMRPLAVTTAQRDPQLPDVPTVSEVGVQHFDIRNWYGVALPAGAPRDIVVKLNAEVNRILQMREVKARLDELGTRLDPMSPEQMTEFVRAEIAKYVKIVKTANIALE